MKANILAVVAAVAALCAPIAGQSQGFFRFETVAYATQTSFMETDGGSGVTATFSSLSATPDAFQVLDNIYPPGTPFYSYNMAGQVLVENSVGDHALEIQFSALQKTLHISFGLPNLAAELIVEIASLGYSASFSGTDLFPATFRDLPYEGEVVLDFGPLRFDAVKLSTVGATDGAFGIDNVRVSAVPEGSSILMMAAGGLPIVGIVLWRRRRV